MTTTLNKISTSIEELLKHHKFEEILNVFIKNNLSSEELVVFYKRNKFLFLNKDYWQSSLPLLHLQKVLESDLKVTCLNSYFSNDDFCNEKINKKILSINQAEFIRFLKFTRAFHKPNFWSSLNRLKNEFVELINLTDELDIINQKINEFETEIKDNNELLLQFSLTELIVGFSTFYQSFKNQKNIIGNKGFQTEIEMALVDEMTRIINLFFERNNQKCEIPFTTNLDLQHYYTGKIKSMSTDLKTVFLFDKINKMIDTKALGGQIDLYCCGYADLKTKENEPFSLETNQSYSEFVFNNKKSQPEEFYIGEVSLFDDPEILKSKRVSGEDEIKYFKYYGIPIELKFENKTVDLQKAFKLIKYFSVYKSPPEPSNAVPQHFKNVFGGNENISLFNYTDFVNNISIFFNWNKEECETIISFMSTNFDLAQKKGNWLANPFIISEGKVLWIGTFLRDRRWENIILNKIKTEKALQSYVKLISKNLELNTIHLFKKAGFKAFGIDKIKTSSGENGEIDVLAYKDGCVIIAEVKSGGRSDNFSYARFSEIIKHEGGAAEQLVKIEQYVKENWESIKKQFNIESPKPFEKIKVYPIIITDYFEGDLELYKEKFSKVSLLELDVIINNTKEKLLKSYHQLQFFSNFNNPKFSAKPIKINYDLWDGKKNISIEALIDKVNTNAVWKEIGNIWNM